MLIEIKMLDNQIETVEAEVFGDFAVHGFAPVLPDWRVTHIPSGAIVRDFSDRESAVAMAQKLDAAKIPGVEKLRIRVLKSGKPKVTDPEGAMAAMKAILAGEESPENRT